MQVSSIQHSGLSLISHYELKKSKAKPDDQGLFGFRVLGLGFRV